MIVECASKTQQKNRKQCARHTAAGAGDAEKIVKRTFVKEQETYSEQEKGKAFFSDIMFFHPLSHTHSINRNYCYIIAQVAEKEKMKEWNRKFMKI